MSHQVALRFLRALRIAGGTPQYVLWAVGLSLWKENVQSSMPAASDRNVDMLIGGQAVLEGVMMRSLTGYSVAVANSGVYGGGMRLARAPWT